MFSYLYYIIIYAFMWNMDKTDFGQEVSFRAFGEFTKPLRFLIKHFERVFRTFAYAKGPQMGLRPIP